ncbi:hypothetical protein BD410DRAFT_726519, partial [Rickenella mellea]
PESLIQWRRSGYDDPERGPRYIWDPLEPFFASHGYILYEAIDGKHIILHAAVKPPGDIPLVVDKSVCKTIVSFEGDKFFSMRTCLCPARTTAGKDVILRIIAKGSAGHDHLQVLRTLNSRPHRCNHAIPLLAELSIGDMTFGVFPTLGESPDSPWFHTYEEAFDFIDQLLEGLSFMHSHLIAHLDISLDNILVNRIGPRKTSFQSRFKVFYYYNDFELTVYFPEHTNPAERIVSGLPTQRLYAPDATFEHVRETYGRDPPPEMLQHSPYCPFKVDVWQLGQMFLSMFEHLSETPHQAIIRLFQSMSSTNPELRPSASAALREFRSEISNTTSCELGSIVPKTGVHAMVAV